MTSSDHLRLFKMATFEMDETTFLAYQFVRNRNRNMLSFCHSSRPRINHGGCPFSWCHPGAIRVSLAWPNGPTRYEQNGGSRSANWYNMDEETGHPFPVGVDDIQVGCVVIARRAVRASDRPNWPKKPIKRANRFKKIEPQRNNSLCHC